MRLGILQADSVSEALRTDHRDYPHMFHDLFAGVGASGSVCFEDYDVAHGEFPAHVDACDAYVITGSRAGVYEEHEWIASLSRFVEELHRQRKKLVGICFGHQLIAQVLGGETGPAPNGWAVGVHESRVTVKTRWMDPDAARFRLISCHKDQVEGLPADAQLLATNAFCPNAAFQIGEHMLAFQGHPEFSKDFSRALMDSRRELFGEERYSEGVASLEQDTHEDLVARWILNFIAE